MADGYVAEVAAVAVAVVAAAVVVEVLLLELDPLLPLLLLAYARPTSVSRVRSARVADDSRALDTGRISAIPPSAAFSFCGFHAMRCD